MRLIDADALINHLDDAIQDAKRNGEICDYWEDDRSNLLYYLDHAPTIDAVEVVHGEWVHDPQIGWGETWLCSICGEKTASSIMGKPRYKYCPMCGARMEEGANDVETYRRG